MDSRLMFSSESYSRALDELSRALRRREALILLVGASGTGKTTLCSAAVRALDAPLALSVITDPFLTIDDLIRQVLHDFGVPQAVEWASARPAAASCHDLIRMLQRFLETQCRADAHALVVIDDAHQIQPAVLAQLRALLNLAGAVPLQILLVGQPELDTLLAQPELQPLRQRVSRRSVLTTLTRREIRPYLDCRSALLASEAPGDDADARRPLLTSRAAAAMGRLSNGNPHALALLYERALEVGAERHAEEIGGRVVLDAAHRLDVHVSALERLRLAPQILMLVSPTAITVVLLWVFWQVGWVRLPLRAASRAASRAAARVTPPPVALSQAPAPVAPPDEEPAANVLPTSTSYVVVVASFETTRYADNLTEQLKTRGLPAFSRTDDGGAWHAVLVGPYASAEEARDAQAQIGLEKFPDAHIRTIDAAEQK